MTQTIDPTLLTNRRTDAQKQGRYDIYIEIDIDCEELVDACGLDYDRTEHDDTQNEICLTFDKDEYARAMQPLDLNYENEQTIAASLLNAELGEYTTKVTIYKPNGDIISFC